MGTKILDSTLNNEIIVQSMEKELDRHHFQQNIADLGTSVLGPWDSFLLVANYYLDMHAFLLVMVVYKCLKHVIYLQMP